MNHIFQFDRGLALLCQIPGILLVTILFAADANTWGQSHPIALPTGSHNSNDSNPTRQTGNFRTVGIAPRIRYSVPEATMNVWRRLACSLPPEYSDVTDLEKLLSEISRYARIPIDVQLSRETLNDIDYFNCCGSDETWFSEIRDELAEHDIEVIVQPTGLVVRAVGQKRDWDADEPEFPGAIQVVYEISELPMGPESLLDMIHNLLRPNMWDENGGDGICEVVTTSDGRYLVVLQREDIQASVLMLLETLAVMSVEPTGLNRQAHLRSSVRDGLIRCAMHSRTQAMVSLLELPTPEHLRKRMPLRELAEYLKSRGIWVHHDITNASDLPNAVSTVIDLRQNRGNLYNDLKSALSIHGFAFSLRTDRMDLEIARTWEPEHELVIYDSTSLQIPDEALRDDVQMMVSPEDWADNGGEGELLIAKVGNRQLIGVWQTPQRQWHVRRFLERLAGFVALAGPMENCWDSHSTPINLPTGQVGNVSSSRAVLIPQPTEFLLTKPDEFSMELWPIHELQADFWTEADREADFHHYPIFYDITSLDVEDEIVYQMLHELVDPDSWEENGGYSIGHIERLGAKKILFANTSSTHHYAIARFLERLTRTLGRPPLRSNWRMEWVPEPMRVDVQNASPETQEVEVFEVPRSSLNFDLLRQSIMETIEPDTWSENGGDYELVCVRINQRQVLVVHHQRWVQQIIKQFLRDRL